MTRTTSLALLVAALAAAAGALAYAIDPVRAAHGWLAVGLAAWSAALGAAFVLAVATLSSATWIVSVRRPFEAVASTLPAASLLLIPPLLAAPLLHAATVPHEHELHHVPGWLAPLPFWARAAPALLIAIVPTEILLRLSRAQDEDGRPRTEPMRRAGALAVVALPLAATLGAFDWIGGLHPTWVSSALGTQLVSSGVLSAIGAATLITLAQRRRGALARIGSAHLHALGTATFVAVCVWAYLQFGPFLIVWIGNRPVTVTFYFPRVLGAWLPIAVTLAIARFALPFAALLFRSVKAHALSLGTLAAILAATGPLELAWWVLPSARPDHVSFEWADLAALTCAIALAIAVSTWRLRDVAALPEGDPLLARSLAYRR